MKRLFVVLCAALVGACTHSVHQATVGGFDDIPRGARIRQIESVTEQRVFLATDNTDFADRAMADLVAQCPRGRVVGVEARHSTSLGFLVFTNRMKMTGHCLEDEPARAPQATR